MTEETGNIKNILELALLSAGQPLTLRALQRLVGDSANAAAVADALNELRHEWSARALQLVESAGGYQFTSRVEYADYLRRLKPQRPPRMSNSLMEVLAIIAYRQPVTRGDIEQLRGVTVSTAQIVFLEEQEWIEEIGRRAAPGRPILYATTKTFLDDLGLSSLDDLPPIGKLSEQEDALAGANGDGDNTANQTPPDDDDEVEKS